MGKAKLTPTSIDLIKNIKDNEKKQAGRTRADYSGVTTITKSIGAKSGSAAGNQTNISSSGLPTSGGTMIGPIAFYGIAVTVSSGAIDVGVGTSSYTSNVIVTGEGGAADDLATISNPSHSGQLIFLQSHTSTVITLKHATGNIWMSDAADYIMAVGEIVILLWDEVNSRWVLIAGGGGGAGGDNLGDHIAIQDLDMGTSDIINVTDIGSSLFAMSDLWVNRIRLQTGVSGTNFPTITASSPTGDMEINVPDTKSIFLNHNGTVKHTFTKTSFTTLGTCVVGGTLSSGAHFSSASATTTITSNLTNITSVDGINLTTSGFSDDIDLLVSGQNGLLTLSATGNASEIRLKANGSTGGTPNGIVDISSTNKVVLDAPNIHVTGKLVYDSDPTNTYIDLVSGGGDITITTKGGTDDIDILADGTGSEIDIISAQSDVVVRGGGSVFIGGPVFTAIQSTSGGINLTLGSGSGIITVQNDLDIGAGSYVDFGSTSGTVGALVGYINVKVAGTLRKIPYYAV